METHTKQSILANNRVQYQAKTQQNTRTHPCQCTRRPDCSQTHRCTTLRSAATAARPPDIDSHTRRRTTYTHCSHTSHNQATPNYSEEN